MYDTLEARLEELEQDSNHVETYRHKDGSVTVVLAEGYIEEWMNPREDDYGVGVMCAKGYRHSNLGDKGDLVDEVHRALREHGPRITTRWLKIFKGATVVLPLGLIDHSGISMYVGAGAHWCDPGGWDSGLVGLIFDTPETRERTGVKPENVEQALRTEVEVYDQYLRGEVYYGVHLTPTGELVETDVDGDTVHGHTYQEDACGGFLGYDNLADVAWQFTDSPIKEAA